MKSKFFQLDLKSWFQEDENVFSIKNSEVGKKYKKENH